MSRSSPGGRHTQHTRPSAGRTVPREQTHSESVLPKEPPNRPHTLASATIPQVLCSWELGKAQVLPGTCAPSCLQAQVLQCHVACGSVAGLRTPCACAEGLKSPSRHVAGPMSFAPSQPLQYLTPCTSSHPPRKHPHPHSPCAKSVTQQNSHRPVTTPTPNVYAYRGVLPLLPHH